LLWKEKKQNLLSKGNFKYRFSDPHRGKKERGSAGKEKARGAKPERGEKSKIRSPCLARGERKTNDGGGRVLNIGEGHYL